MRRPMEVKNVWVTGQRGEGKGRGDARQQQHRPGTPELAVRYEDLSHENMWEMEERQT
jgi:hypothetical protein